MGDRAWNGTNKSLNAILDETDDFLKQLPTDERNARVNGKHWTPLESLWTVADHEISTDDFVVAQYGGQHKGKEQLDWHG